MVLIGRRQLRSNNSWMHNLPALVKGKDRCTVQVHPDDAERLGLADGGRARVSSASGELVAPVEITDEIMPGVVSIPHGWGHDAPGVRLAVAAEHAGVNSNLLAPVDVDVPSGNAVLNGIPVEVTAADREPAAARPSAGRRRGPARVRRGRPRRRIEALYSIARRRAAGAGWCGRRSARARGERILDVGCGPGFYVAELLEEVGAGRARWSASTASERDAGAGRAPLRGARRTSSFARGRRDRAPGRRRRLRRRAHASRCSSTSPDLTRRSPRSTARCGPAAGWSIWDVDWTTLSMRTRRPRADASACSTPGTSTSPTSSLPRTLTAQLRAGGLRGRLRWRAHAFATNELDPRDLRRLCSSASSSSS